MKSKLTIDKYGNKWSKLPNGGYHREDGPALEFVNGDKYWYINGKRHREDGPAIEYYDGYKAWFLNGIEYSEHEHKKKMRLNKLKHIL